MLSVTESQYVNTLADWILGPPAGQGGSADKVSDGQARDALALLALQAYERLGTGITDRQVFDRWPGRNVRALEGPADQRRRGQ